MALQLPSLVTDLIDQLSRFPGVGKRTAQRYALGLLQWPPEQRQELLRSLERINLVAHCQDCGAFAEPNSSYRSSAQLSSDTRASDERGTQRQLSESAGINNPVAPLLCLYCQPLSGRFRHQVCVVESFADVMAIERTQGYQGLYHILGGLLSPLRQIGPKELNLSPFAARLERGEIQEVILALNPTMEGDATCSYLGQLLQSFPVTVLRLGQGIPMGSQLEHLDPLTISSALAHRKALL